MIIDGKEWKLVPVEPTRNMTLNGCDSLPCVDGVWGRAGELSANVYRAMLRAAPAAPTAQGQGNPDDIRTAGWAVAVHNDYRLHGQPHTFWLFTKGDRAVKGEGLTDAEALNAVRRSIGLLPSAPSAGEARS